MSGDFGERGGVGKRGKGDKCEVGLGGEVYHTLQFVSLSHSLFSATYLAFWGELASRP